MPLFSSCPVCAYPVTSDERQCPCCAWQLESDYTFGRVTPAVRQQYEEELRRAQQQWRKNQQQHAAERALAAAQARLRHVQRVCAHAHRVTRSARLAPTVSPTVPLSESEASPTPPPTSPSSLAAQHPPYWFKRLWWAIFQPERLAAYHQQREGR